MTIECMSCHMILGEKCSKCGARAMVYMEIFPRGVTSTSARFGICKNWDCERKFPVGDGGVTYGVCPECCRRLLEGVRKETIRPLKNSA